MTSLHVVKDGRKWWWMTEELAAKFRSREEKEKIKALLSLGWVLVVCCSPWRVVVGKSLVQKWWS